MRAQSNRKCLHVIVRLVKWQVQFVWTMPSAEKKQMKNKYIHKYIYMNKLKIILLQIQAFNCLREKSKDEKLGSYTGLRNMQWFFFTFRPINLPQNQFFVVVVYRINQINYCIWVWERENLKLIRAGINYMNCVDEEKKGCIDPSWAAIAVASCPPVPGGREARVHVVTILQFTI